jgi:O-antigen/teichoic acid export membrane protein/pSer/pThr/pTyr-binding forkhead associated (FHA) protein
MAIFICPACTTNVQVLDQHLGKRVLCPLCREPFVAAPDQPVKAQPLVRSATINTVCPSCLNTCRVPAQMRGYSVRCPWCRNSFRVPEPSLNMAPRAAPARPRTHVIRFSCPRCNHLLAVPEHEAGTKLPCPRCGQRLQVPEPPREQTLMGKLRGSSARRGRAQEPLPPASSAGRMVVISGSDTGKIFGLPERGAVTIGRVKEHPIFLNDMRVSRSHCRVEVDRGRVTVTDVGSRYGTFVNGAQVTQQLLQPNDILQVGDTQLRLDVPNVSNLETLAGQDKEGLLELLRRERRPTERRISVKCPTCGQVLQAREQLAGTRALCPCCGEMLQLPDKAAAESPPAPGDAAPAEAVQAGALPLPAPPVSEADLGDAALGIFQPPSEEELASLRTPIADQAAGEAADEEEQATIRQGSVKKAVVWIMTGWGLGYMLKFVQNPILAALLIPEAFGLMALVFAFIAGLHLFSDLGIGPSVVQSKRGDDPKFVNTAWTLQILRGIGLWLITVAIAWPVALLYDKPPEPDKPQLPSLLWMLPAVGLATAISGFNSTAMYTLDRKMLQGRRVAFQLGTDLIGLAVTIAVAWYTRSVWALVVSNLVAAVLGLIVSHVIVPGTRNRLYWDRTAIPELLHFSRWVLYGSALTFVADKTDYFVISKLSFAVMGIYHFALQVAGIPMGLLGPLTAQLVFPRYSRLLEAGADPYQTFRKIHTLTIGFGAYMVTGLIVAGPTFARFLWDFRYEGVARLVPLLMLGMWFRVLESTGDAFLWALGRAHMSAYSQGLKVLSLPVLVPLGYWIGGQEGVILGFVTADFVRYGLSMLYIRSLGYPVLRCDSIVTLLIVVTAALGLFLDHLIWPASTEVPFLSAIGGFTHEDAIPGFVPWGALGLPAPHKRDRAQLFLRLSVEAALVTLIWAVVAVIGLVVLRKFGKRSPEPVGGGNL